jgi:hypothetical protein
MPESSKQAFIKAVKALKNRPLGSLGDMSSWNYDQFTKAHFDATPYAHGTPAFLPWHRHFIWGFEQALKSIDSSVALPFWDWSLDSQRVADSDIVQPEYFGTTGDPKNHNCVTNGIAAGWNVLHPPPAHRFGQHCLRRCFQFTALYTPEQVVAVINAGATYDTFRTSLENGPHGYVHAQGGGKCSDVGVGDLGFMSSANDPLFFVHHAMVDKIWLRWQNSCETFATLYGGGSAKITDLLAPWGIPVTQTMNSQGNQYCYKYEDSPSDLPLNVKCPVPPKVTASLLESSNNSTSDKKEESPIKDDRNWFLSQIYDLIPGGKLVKRSINLDAMQAMGMGSMRDRMEPMRDRMTPMRDSMESMRSVGADLEFEEPLKLPDENPVEYAEPLQTTSISSLEYEEPTKTSPIADSTNPESTSEMEVVDFIKARATQTISSDEDITFQYSSSAPKDVAPSPEALAYFAQLAHLYMLSDKTTFAASKPTELLAEFEASRPTQAALPVYRKAEPRVYKDIKLPAYVPPPFIKVQAPPRRNYSDQVHIRYMEPLPLSYIKMMNLDPVRVRQLEFQMCRVTDRVNNQEGYVSPAALMNWKKFNPKAAHRGSRRH